MSDERIAGATSSPPDPWQVRRRRHHLPL